jgi:hypothetical protein
VQMSLRYAHLAPDQRQAQRPAGCWAYLALTVGWDSTEMDKRAGVAQYTDSRLGQRMSAVVRALPPFGSWQTERPRRWHLADAAWPECESPYEQQVSSKRLDCLFLITQLNFVRRNDCLAHASQHLVGERRVCLSSQPHAISQ